MGGRAPREAGETVPPGCGASDEPLGRIGPNNHPAAALRAAARACRASWAGRLEGAPGARRRARDAGRLSARARRGTARCAARLAPGRRRRGAGGVRAGRHLRQPRGLPRQRSAQRLVVGDRGSRRGPRHRRVPGPRLRLPRRERGLHGPGARRRGSDRGAQSLPQHLQLRSGGGAGAASRSPRPRNAPCHRRRSHPLATAWRSIQRRIVSLAAACGQAQEGLKVARALAMTTYRSAAELAARFGGTASRDGQRFVFPVEEYLFARGCDYATRHRAESFLTLSESIDLHRVDASRVFVPTTVVAVREDQLVPLEDLRALAARLPHGRLHEISSIYGHDAFLKESYQLRGIFRAALGSPK
ncbi:MAG: alpha/beta fold hydrolase [Gammaproteobacteria bacterium]|nr:MAG: alpha/beta fold hydrolase [Gammaproteobacteria bacterium]